MTPYRIKRHRKRLHSHDNHMALVPFIDMLMIMVVFLLVHTSDVEVLPNTKNISIPESIAEKDPRPSVVVMITKDEVLVDGRAIAAKQNPADREVTILGDRHTPYSVLRKVMATCTEANYGKVSLAVIEREQSGVPRTASLVR